MTDDKNKNPEEGMEEDFADFEEDFAEEGLDEGLEEGFHEEEGEEFVEEDWDAYDEEGDFPAAADGGKKSSKLLVIIGGLVLLGGGGYVAMQFMGGGTVPQQQGATGAPDMADALPVPDASMSDDSAVGADMASRNEMPAPAAEQDFTPPPSNPELDFEMPMPFSNSNEPEAAAAGNDSITADQGQLSMDGDAAAVEEQPLTPLPPQDGTEMDGAPDLVASGDAAAEMQQDGANSAGQGSDSKIPAWAGQGGADSPDRSNSTGSAGAGNAENVDNSALASLESKLDRLFNRLDSIESELEQVKKNSGADANVKALEEKIRRLERDIGNMDSAPARRGGSNRSPASADSGASDSRSSGSSASMPAANADHWVLTSAQPGKATLRRQGGSDVISVEVGDSVAGLGRVISVGLEDGKWVVKATSGSVSQ